SILNGQEVFVESDTLGMFTAFVVNGPVLTINGLSGSAVSITGQFLGPNIGSIATGPSWTSPNSIYSPTGFASIDSSTAVAVTGTPTAAVNQGPGGIPWTNPTNVFSTSTYATVSLSPSSDASEQL